MAQIETQGILQDIQTLVSDQLQVVSYKWLSRNYLVSSNDAKRLLQEFVESHGNGLEVVYTLSGQLKNNPVSYHVRLVSGPQLAEAKEEFDGNCSVGVYSVQPCIPKDPATMWNAEFVQAEELHTQAPTVENCLRDNRFCGILNSFVMRNVEGTPTSTTGPQPNSKLAAEPSKINLPHQGSVIPKQPQNKGQQSSPNVVQTANVVKDVKSESNGIEVAHQPKKPPAGKEKVAPLPANKKKVQNDKSSSASGGSLANMWGRASVKSKSLSTAENRDSAEAQICVREVEPGAISDDDDQDVNFRRASSSEATRKRRVIFDFSDEDECEDAINLASPEYAKENSCQEANESGKTLVPHKTNLNFDEQSEDKPEVKEEISVGGESDQTCREDTTIFSKKKNSGIILTEKIEKVVPENDVKKIDKLTTAAKTQRDADIILTEKKRNSVPENDANKTDKPTNGASRSPQRRKILKTQIDERGREVTEVIWEGKETEEKKADSLTTAKADSSTTKKADNTVKTVSNRSPAVPKPVANTGPKNQTTKAGGKKVVNKDPKQGNILSFFKKV
ncbi:uncharacterized protein LOC126789071 isoform X2 [Argentina anserina]|uniref:uncharacterized protein LOC126789071 isoform X2 n=1 Tax=Argentina anserina TaxID=57926 RepID=UPI00217650BC|nr:uncharacterized protein LOC126789071 isoform X2 [Potentilla anserina]